MYEAYANHRVQQDSQPPPIRKVEFIKQARKLTEAVTLVLSRSGPPHALLPPSVISGIPGASTPRRSRP